MSHTPPNPGSRWSDFHRKVVRKLAGSLPAATRNLLHKHFEDQSMELGLERLRARGFSPGWVVDCGAYQGDWCRMIKRVFPAARVIMFEPQADKRAHLLQVQSDFPGEVDYVASLLGPEEKAAVTFFEMESGSSVLEELTNCPRQTVALPMRTLDGVLQEKNVQAAALLKLDVQGYEIEVLKGARAAMRQAEVILLEVSFLPYNRSAPLFAEVIRFMAENDFVAYDFCNFQRWGQTLLQADVFFVKKDSALRKVALVLEQFADNPGVPAA
ncbi:MAG: FkbM family methyltransferase [Verrucomicrobia bacterium]|nr:FkbM family methyltransferase [Verrucomicrobiota bacterium]